MTMAGGKLTRQSAPNGAVTRIELGTALSAGNLYASSKSNSKNHHNGEADKKLNETTGAGLSRNWTQGQEWEVIEVNKVGSKVESEPARQVRKNRKAGKRRSSGVVVRNGGAGDGEVSAEGVSIASRVQAPPEIEMSSDDPTADGGTRQRTSSIDELKLALRSSEVSPLTPRGHRVNMTLNSTCQDDNSHSPGSDAEADEESGKSYGPRLENGRSSVSGNFGADTSRLTDFERFVAENKDVDFQEECFASQAGEDCSLCEFENSLCDSPQPEPRDKSVITGCGGIHTNWDEENSQCASGLGSLSSSQGAGEIHSRVSGVTLNSFQDSSNGCYEPNARKKHKSRETNCVVNGDKSASFTTCQSSGDISDQSVPCSSKAAKRKHSSGSSVDSSQSQQTGSSRVKTARLERSPGSVEICRETCDVERPDGDHGEAGQSLQEPVPTGNLFVPDWVYVALDCEMVGTGPKGRVSVLGRCSIVDYNGHVLYDKFVRPDVPITDYRTAWSGIRPSHMRTAEPLAQALADIKQLLANKIIVGHSVYNDFRVLQLTPPFYLVRDTAQSKALIRMAGLEGQGNGLKKLAAALLGRRIQAQSSGHCSVEDARASLDLFKMVRSEYEPELYRKWAGRADRKTMSELATFVQRVVADGLTGVKGEGQSDSQFLEDQYWPEDVLH